MSDFPVMFVEDNEEAHREHGEIMRKSLMRLAPNSGRWASGENSMCTDADALAVAAWESGFDAAVMLCYTIRDRLAKVQAAYNELVMSVGNKYEGETRHQTALRYIRAAETFGSDSVGTGWALNAKENPPC